MKLYKFQNGTKDYKIGVLYETHGECYRLQSDDEGRSELYLQASNLVFMACALFGLEDLHASLKEIAFSDGQDGKATRLVLTLPTATADFAKLQLPKVPRREVVDSKTKEPIIDHPRNLYNSAVDLMELQIAEYVQGRRKQAVLDFEAEEERIANGKAESDEDYDEEDSGQAAEKRESITFRRTALAQS